MPYSAAVYALSKSLYFFYNFTCSYENHLVSSLSWIIANFNNRYCLVVLINIPSSHQIPLKCSNPLVVVTGTSISNYAQTAKNYTCISILDVIDWILKSLYI